MEIFGVGWMEIVFIVILALLLLGPSDMEKTGRQLAKLIRAVITSDTWRALNEFWRNLRYLPNKWMREAGLEDIKKGIPDISPKGTRSDIAAIKSDLQQWQKDISSWTTPPSDLPASPSIAPTQIPSPPPPQTASPSDPSNPTNENTGQT
jgi:hypothetical protein